MVRTKYYTGYPGGPIAYLDEWETTIPRHDNVAPKEKHSSDQRRTMFAQQFVVHNDTEAILESARDNTDKNTFFSIGNQIALMKKTFQNWI